MYSNRFGNGLRTLERRTVQELADVAQGTNAHVVTKDVTKPTLLTMAAVAGGSSGTVESYVDSGYEVSGVAI